MHLESCQCLGEISGIKNLQDSRDGDIEPESSTDIDKKNQLPTLFPPQSSMVLLFHMDQLVSSSISNETSTLYGNYSQFMWGSGSWFTCVLIQIEKTNKH